MGVLEAWEIGKILLDYFDENDGVVRDWEREISGRPHLLEQLAAYLDLLLKWNDRTNLSAIRDPAAIVRRHFGESLFAASLLRSSGTLLDLGSGAGFPGVPVQLWHPELRVTLAESQGKKSAFLREVVRRLGLETEVWGRRAEDFTKTRKFDGVILRAVDTPGDALATAFDLSKGDVWLLGSELSISTLPPRFWVVSRVALPGSQASNVFRMRRATFHVEHEHRRT